MSSNSSSPLIGDKKEENGRDFQCLRISDFRVRRLDFSLKYWEIRPLAVVGTRREADLREETYAYALRWRVAHLG